MNECSEITNHLVDYVLAELEPEVEIQVNDHLAVCEACRFELQRRESIIEGFRNSAKYRPSSDLYSKIAGRFKVRESQRGRLLGVPRSLVFAFGAFVLGVVITSSIDRVIANVNRTSRMESWQQIPDTIPFSDTVEFYSVPAKNLASI